MPDFFCETGFSTNWYVYQKNKVAWVLRFVNLDSESGNCKSKNIVKFGCFTSIAGTATFAHNYCSISRC